MAILDRLRMPTFGGATGWLNSEPLGRDDLRGHVVLADFWTFTCINWLRTEPYIRTWAEAYRDDGLIVVGVHTPEFSFEHETPRVQEQVRQRAIDYPVALDNNYDVWRSFSNNYWPALYFVDREGVVRDHHFGEGRYEESERVVQRMLGVRRDLVQVEGRGVEAEADWAHLRSPETYLGSGAGERRVEPNGLRLTTGASSGDWTISPGTRRPRHARGEHRIPLLGTGRAPRPFAPDRRADPLPRHPRRQRARRFPWARCRRGRHGCARRGPSLPVDPTTRRRPRAHARDHLPQPGAEAYVFTFG